MRVAPSASWPSPLSEEQTMTTVLRGWSLAAGTVVLTAALPLIFGDVWVLQQAIGALDQIRFSLP